MSLVEGRYLEFLYKDSAFLLKLCFMGRVARLGDLLDFGQLFKDCGNN